MAAEAHVGRRHIRPPRLMRDNYILSSFLGAPQSILGGIFLFVSAVLFGQCLMYFGLYFTDPQALGTPFGFNVMGVPFSGKDLVLAFLTSLILTFGYGSFSVVGLIFLVINFWFIYRLMFADEPAHSFFCVIAANQIGLFLCAMLFWGEFEQGLLVGCVLWIALWLLNYGAKKLKTKLIERQIARNEAP